MRLTSNLHVGLVLGITTAGVILALSGCVTAPTPSQGSAAPASAGANAAMLEPFSESERERIVAVQGIVEQAAAEHGIDADLINAVIWVESKFEPDAKSPAGARGLMQLMPSTAAYLAKRMGEHNPRSYDPEFNVRAGSLYLAEMIEKFGDERYAVAAYHAGPGNVKKWIESNTAFPEYSDSYVAKVMDARARFEGGQRHGGTNAARQATTGSEPKPAKNSREGKLDVEPEPESQPQPQPQLDEDALEPPPLDTLPDAAEIHGMARVVYLEPEQEPEQEPESQPAFGPADDVEPVFVVHRELDANPQAKNGWVIASRAPARSPRRSDPSAAKQRPAAKPEPAAEPEPAAKPEPQPQPKQEPDPSDVAGLGVLPDL